MEIKQIKPVGKKSDKYSINLYKYLKRNPEYTNVYYQSMHKETSKDTKYIEQLFNINSFNINDIYLSCYPEWYIERDGLITGRRLISVLRGGRDMYENYAIGSSVSCKYVDITDVFWDKYIKIGRCIWDKSHDGWLQDDENRFEYIDEDNRKCNWCGEIQHRETKEEKIVRKYNIWITDTTKN